MNLLGRLFGALQGRTTAFAIAFFVGGHVLHWVHRLDSSYIAFMATLMGFVVGHSIKEDWAARNGAPPSGGSG